MGCVNCDQQIKYTTMSWSYYKDVLTGKFERTKPMVFDENKLFVCVPCIKPKEKCIYDKCKLKCIIDENDAILLSFTLHRLFFERDLFSFSNGRKNTNLQADVRRDRKLFDPEKVYIKSVNMSKERKKYG